MSQTVRRRARPAAERPSSPAGGAEESSSLAHPAAATSTTDGEADEEQARQAEKGVDRCIVFDANEAIAARSVG